MTLSPPIVGAVKGRGARSNHTGRFESLAGEDVDDGWTADDREVPRLHTVIQAEAAKTIITRNDSPDINFDRSINPYRGCEHGCIYCFARPAHAYVGLSPGLDFETKLFFKPDAAVLLERELSRPSYRCERIQLGANTDPYQPIEKGLGITREILKVLRKFRHPVTITTKNAMVTRDIDILAEMAAEGLASVAMSVTTLDRKLARSMEPRASTPEKRIEAIERLSAAGVPTMAIFAPAIPGLNDHELEAVLERAAGAGAVRAGYVLLRLPWEIKDLFREWLDGEHPDRARKVMSLIRQARGGKDYDAAWGKRQRGEGPIAELIARRFKLAAKRHNLDRPFPGLDTSKFKVPTNQMDLFSPPP